MIRQKHRIMKEVYFMPNITESIRYVGVNDYQVDLFEGQYVVPNGMSYNSYVIMDEKIAVMDTVDIHFTHEWLDNVANVLDGINKMMEAIQEYLKIM